MRTWYNENDPQIVAWLRELRAEGLIPDGAIDERSIEDVRPNDCAPTSHFFAGIAGWAYALELAGWPADAPVWTGSCPCQPFSSAGKGGGFADKRHLWPAWRRLIAQCRPTVCFGEQVASPLGREWFAGVRADLEALGYEVGATDLCAAGVGAPHIRQRLFWVADAEGERHDRRNSGREKARRAVAQNGGGMGDASTTRLQKRKGREGIQQAQMEASARKTAERAGNPWSRFDFLQCSDGKARRTEPGIEPLAHGVPARVVRLRGYGNALIPQVAAVFVRAYMEARGLV